MANNQKVKGDRWERVVLAYLQTQHDAKLQRTKAGMTHDVGDISGDHLVAYECRDRKRIDYAQSALDARRHAEEAGKAIGVAIIKRPRKPAGEAIVVMTLDDYLKLRILAGDEA